MEGKNIYGNSKMVGEQIKKTRKNTRMSLLICCSPLQVLIAEKICKKEKIKNYFFILLAPVYNEKYYFYYEKLAKDAKDSMLVNIRRNHTCTSYEKLKNLLSFRKKILPLKGIQFDSVFVANIESLEVHLLLSQISFDNFYTFDDGTSNIMYTSFLYKKYQPSLINRLMRFILKINLNIEILKEKIVYHFSIYEGQKNISSRIKLINLLDCQDKKNIKNLDLTGYPPYELTGIKKVEIRKIFLGQPIFENENDSRIFHIVFEKYQFDFYFPHPRDTCKQNICPYIETKLIFEDYILREVYRNPHVTYEVYTFFSTTVLNIQKIKGIYVFLLKPKLEKFQEYEEIYDFFSKKSIPIINIDIESTNYLN